MKTDTNATITRHSRPIRPAEDGDRLYRPRVRDLMTPEPVTLAEEDTLAEAEELFRWKGIRHLPITDAEGRIAGLLTHRDFLTVAVSKLAHLDPSDLKALYGGIRVGEVMGRKITTVDPELPLEEAAAILWERKYGCLPVTDERGRLVGIITEADFVRAFLDRDARFAG